MFNRVMKYEKKKTVLNKQQYKLVIYVKTKQ